METRELTEEEIITILQQYTEICFTKVEANDKSMTKYDNPEDWLEMKIILYTPEDEKEYAMSIHLYDITDIDRSEQVLFQQVLQGFVKYFRNNGVLLANCPFFPTGPSQGE